MRCDKDCVEQLVAHFWESYCRKRDIEAIGECIAGDFRWYGTAEFEHADNKQELLLLMEEEFLNEPESYDYTVEQWDFNELAQGCWYVCGPISFVKGGVCLRARFTAVCRNTRDGWQIAAVHVSTINAYQKENEYFPQSIARENAKFNFLLESMCENFMEVDTLTHQSTLVLPKENRILTGTFEEHIQGFADNVVVPEEREQYVQEFCVDRLVENIRKNNGMYVNHCNVEYEDGRHYLMICNTLLEMENGHTYIFLYAQDLTDIKRQEERSRKVIEKALKRAEKASEAKTNFLSHMSHEIRTPLNGIIGMQSVMEEASDMAELKQYLAKARISAQQLLCIVNDILDMSKIESGKLVLDRNPTNPEIIINRVKAIIEPIAEEKKQSVTFTADAGEEEGYLIFTDKNRMVQILLNLLSNAVKYTEDGGKIQLHKEASRLDNHIVRERFTIKDNGIGMTEKFQKKLFKPFEQESVSSVKTGTGLGLAITKRLVDAMNGKIEIESKPGQGTTVCVQFEFSCIRKEDRWEEENAEEHIRQVEGERVLVIEDNEINLEIEKIMLESAGFLVDTARDGKEGVEKFRLSEDGYYKIVFTDIMMPLLDGYGVAKAIREMNRKDSQKVCIVAVTANAFAQDVKKTKESGMNYHISKPFTREDILDIVEKMRI